VTATTRRILSGSATVTVKCPAGQVEFEGECRTISVTIAPANPTVAPGAQQQFTATVHNTTNQAVTWTSNAGSINATARFTAPTQTGTVTITARSKEDTTKSGTTTVTVSRPGVNVLNRLSTVDFANTRASARTSNLNCPPGSTQFGHDSESRTDDDPLGTWDSGVVGSSATAPLVACQSSSADASASVSTHTVHDVESDDGDFTVTFTASDQHSLALNRTGTLLDNDITSVVYTTSSRTALAPGPPIALIEDTTPATTVTLPPGSYTFAITNETSRRRINVTDSASFSFGAAAECHTVS
jgi:Bacterial Ig-like domain (group 2)